MKWEKKGKLADPLTMHAHLFWLADSLNLAKTTNV